MARRGNADPITGLVALLILIVVPAAIFFLSYLSPIALALLLLYFELEALKLPPISDCAEFADPSDIDELTPLHSKRNKALRRLRAIERQAEQVGLIRRQDGGFDERNSLGRKFNFELADLASEIESLESEISQKKELVTGRVRKWLRTLSGRLALRSGGALYCLVALVGYLSGANGSSGLIAASCVSLVAIPLVWWIDYERRKQLLSGLDDFLSKWQTVEPEEQNDSDFSAQPEAEDQNQTESLDDHARPWFEVLGVRPEASREEIIAARNHRVWEYHPDRLKSIKGLSSEIEDFATEKLAEINAAYETAMAEPNRRSAPTSDDQIVPADTNVGISDGKESLPGRPTAANPRRFSLGDKIEAKWRDGYWYPGEIIRIKGDKYEIRWDDWNPEDTHWIPIKRIRELSAD